MEYNKDFIPGLFINTLKALAVLLLTVKLQLPYNIAVEKLGQ